MQPELLEPDHKSVGQIEAHLEHQKRCQKASYAHTTSSLGSREVHFGLTDTLVTLKVHLALYGQPPGLFRSLDEVLDYVEHITTYTIQDYSREYENSIPIRPLWDAVYDIHALAQAWQDAHDKSDISIIQSIDTIVRQAITGRYKCLEDASR